MPPTAKLLSMSKALDDPSSYHYLNNVPLNTLVGHVLQWKAILIKQSTTQVVSKLGVHVWCFTCKTLVHIPTSSETLNSVSQT